MYIYVSVCCIPDYLINFRDKASKNKMAATGEGEGLGGGVFFLTEFFSHLSDNIFFFCIEPKMAIFEDVHPKKARGHTYELLVGLLSYLIGWFYRYF